MNNQSISIQSISWIRRKEFYYE